MKKEVVMTAKQLKANIGKMQRALTCLKTDKTPARFVISSHLVEIEYENEVIMKHGQKGKCKCGKPGVFIADGVCRYGFYCEDCSSEAVEKG